MGYPHKSLTHLETFWNMLSRLEETVTIICNRVGSSSWLKLISLIVCNYNLSENVATPPKKKLGGVCKRVQQKEPPAPKRSRADSSERPQEASSSSSRPVSGGIRKRVAAAQRSAGPPKHGDTPLTTVMKKKWGKGKVSATYVAEIFDGAERQGASGLRKMASLDHPQNLHRSLVAAFGHPLGAPDFSARGYRCVVATPSTRFCCPACGSRRCTRRCYHGGRKQSEAQQVPCRSIGTTSAIQTSIKCIQG